ncbi:unnamed protein product [Moneuplotes crassus]|uniref:Uncharacterized protein n=1 Tax=Euplotes crassus TaxID=5936 RepID=A0AAD1XUE1_EUPCR|nr:unnamed protein product [Moneuplotes crassus]
MGASCCAQSQDSILALSGTSRGSGMPEDKSMTASDSVHISHKFYMRNRMDTVTEKGMESSSTIFQSHLRSAHSKDEDDFSKNMFIENTQDTSGF